MRELPGPMQPRVGLPRPNEPWVPSPGARPIELGEVIGEGRYATVYRIRGAPGAPERVLKVYRQPAGSSTPPAETVRSIVKGADLLGDDIPQLKILRAGPDAPQPYIIQEAARGDAVKIFGDTPSRADFGPEYQEAVVELYKKFADKGLVWEDGHIKNIYFFRDGDGRMAAGVLDQDRIARFGDRSGKLGDMVNAIEQNPSMNGFLRNDIQSLRGSTFPDELGDAPVFPDAEFFMEKMLEYGGRWMRYNGQAFEPVLIDPRIAAKHFRKLPDHVNYDFARRAPSPDRPPFRVEGVDGPDPRFVDDAGGLRLQPAEPLVRRGADELATARSEVARRFDDARARHQRLKDNGGSPEAIAYAKDRLDELEQRADLLEKLQAEVKAGNAPRLSQSDMDWLHGRQRTLGPSEMRQATRMVDQQFGGDWAEVTSALSKGPAANKLLLHKLLTARKQEVDFLVGQAMKEVEALTGKKLRRKAFGSTNLTSDYDLSIEGPGAELVVKKFNDRFRAKYGKEPGSFFDTNVYTSPVYDFIDPASTVGKRLSPAQQDVVRQFMYEQVANVKYMDAEQWERHAAAMVESAPAGMHQTYRRLLDEVASKQHAAEQAVRKRLIAGGSDPDAASPDELLRARNQLYEDALDRIHHLREIASSLDELAAGRSVPPDRLEEMLRRTVKPPPRSMEDTAFGRDLATYQSLRAEGKLGEAAELLGEMRATVNSHLRHNQGNALYYASEAYQTQGTIAHVVGDLQATGRGKTLTGADLLKDPPADLPLSRGQYISSFQENNANLHKELNAVRKKLAKKGVDMGGPPSEAFRRVDPSKASDAAKAAEMAKLAEKSATKAAKYFVRQLDAAHRSGVNLAEALPDRLRYLIEKTVDLDRARSDGDAFAAVLAGSDPAKSISPQTYTADALEAAEILSRRVNARSPMLDHADALAGQFREVDDLMDAVGARPVRAPDAFETVRLEAPDFPERLAESSVGSPDIRPFDYPPVDGPRVEIPAPSERPPSAVPEAPVHADFPKAGHDFPISGGASLKLGDKLGEGKYSEVFALRDRPEDAVKFVHRGDGDAFTQWTPKQTAERAKTVSDELEKAGIPQLKVREVGGEGDEAFVIVERKRDGMEIFDEKTFTPSARDRMIADGKWTPDHERAVGELFAKLADEGFVWEDCHVGNIFFERVDGTMVAGVVDHGRLARWDALDEIMDNWMGLLRLNPRKHHLLSNIGRDYRTYQFSGPHEFMGKMLEHKGWIRFDAESGSFRPGMLDPGVISPDKFPLEEWVNPALRSPPAGDPTASVFRRGPGARAA